MRGHAVLVGVLPPTRQVTRLGNHQQTRRRTRNPSHHSREHPDGQGHGDDGRQPSQAGPLEHVVVGHQQALRQIDVRLGNDKCDCQRAQHENQHRAHGRQHDGDRVVPLWVVHFLHVDGVHFHAGIKQENACRQDDVVKVGEVGDDFTP
ncbi:hypothetical protein D3C73_1167110 [compost metagenome]